MLINGIEYGFCLTTEAGIKLAKICPDGDIAKFGQMLDGKDYAKSAENLAAIAEILSDGYANKEEYEHGRTVPRLTKEELHDVIMHSPLFRYNEMNTEIVVTIIRDLVGEVDAEEKPGKSGKKDETGAGA
jgi:hypothetical protein